MKCTNCGFESEMDYPVCPQCQAQLQANPAAEKILGILKDSLFLAVCILMSAVCGLSFIAGSVPLINVLITIFLWLTYAQSKKGIADPKHLRCISGAVYANYVITYVLAGLVALMGVIFGAVFGMAFSDANMIDSIVSGLGDVDVSLVTDLLSTLPGIIVTVAFILAAAIIIVLNVFSLRYIYRFAKSVYQSIEAGELELKHTGAAKIWLFIYGGFTVIAFLTNLGGDLIPALCSAAEAAAAIIAGVLINKHFSEPVAPRIEMQ